MVKNPPANAGAIGFDPWSGKIPHAAGQLSQSATNIKFCAQEPMCHNY